MEAFRYRTPLLYSRGPAPPPPSPPPPPPAYVKVSPAVEEPESPREAFGLVAVLALVGSLSGAAAILALAYVWFQMSSERRDRHVAPETKDRWVMDEFRDQAILALTARAHLEEQGMLPAPPAPAGLLMDKPHEDGAGPAPRELTVLALPAPPAPAEMPGVPREGIPRPHDPTSPAALAATKYDVAGNVLMGPRTTIRESNPYRDGAPPARAGGAFSLAAYATRPAPPKPDAEAQRREVGISLNDRLAAKIRAGAEKRAVVAEEEAAHARDASWARGAPSRPGRDRDPPPGAFTG